MFGARLRERRRAQGLTQAELAARAGVSRQLVGAVENGRHLPRVDAAVALATAVGVAVEQLQDPRPARAVPVLDQRIEPGRPVRVGRVGDRLVCAPPAASWDSWAVADAVLGADGLDLLDGARPGTVVVGCDPAIGLAARLATDRSADGVLAVAGSTADALAALAAGRTHACVVHGRDGDLPTPPVEVIRWHLSRWQVGLAAPTAAHSGWPRDATAGRTQVIQRSSGAGSQAAFERAVLADGGEVPSGPSVPGHLEAAWLSSHTGLPAVTIEPAALASALDFHPLETHVAELWVARTWADERGVRRLGDAMTSPAFGRRLEAVGGYDLTDRGTPVAA